MTKLGHNVRLPTPCTGPIQRFEAPPASSRFSNPRLIAMNLTGRSGNATLQSGKSKANTGTELEDRKNYAQSTPVRWCIVPSEKWTSLLRRPAKRERDPSKRWPPENQAKFLPNERVNNWRTAMEHHAELESPDSTHNGDRLSLTPFELLLLLWSFPNLLGHRPERAGLSLEPNMRSMVPRGIT